MAVDVHDPFQSVLGTSRGSYAFPLLLADGFTDSGRAEVARLLQGDQEEALRCLAGSGRVTPLLRQLAAGLAQKAATETFAQQRVWTKWLGTLTQTRTHTADNLLVLQSDDRPVLHIRPFAHRPSFTRAQNRTVCGLDCNDVEQEKVERGFWLNPTFHFRGPDRQPDVCSVCAQQAYLFQECTEDTVYPPWALESHRRVQRELVSGLTAELLRNNRPADMTTDEFERTASATYEDLAMREFGTLSWRKEAHVLDYYFRPAPNQKGIQDELRDKNGYTGPLTGLLSRQDWDDVVRNTVWETSVNDPDLALNPTKPTPAQIDAYRAELKRVLFLAVPA